MKRNFVGTVLSLTLVAGVAGMLLLAAGSASAQAAQTDPTSVLVAFEQAVGTNVDAAVALVTEDAVLKIVPPPAGTTGLWTGKDQVRQALEYSLAHKVNRQIMGTPQVDGNKVTALAMVTNDAFQHLGVAPVQFSTVAVVENGKIKSYTSIISPSEQPRVVAAAQAAAAAQAQQAPASAPAAAPSGMPRTGDNATTTIVAQLLALVGLCSIVLGAAVRLRPRLTKR